MKKWKSIVSGLLAGIMILSTAVSAAAANISFTDTSSHWAKSQINYLVSKNVLNGYQEANGTYTFKPDGTVTRAEFIKMLDETFGLTATSPINYSDVKSSDWFHPYISKAAAQGYLLNYGSSISPNGKLTREEATTLLVRYLGLLGGQKASSSQFSDYYSISSHFRDPVMIAVQAGLINGYQETNGTYTFRPQNTLTRAEALTILYRAAGAIYNTSAYSKDSGSADTNAAITKGGVTLSGLRLTGRVIVTEGVSGDTVTLSGCTVTGNLDVRGTSNLILDGCTVENLVLDSASTISISLSGGTRVKNMTLDTPAKLNIASGCTVESLIVNTGAKNVDVRGNGSITKANVYAGGFTSTMMPTEFMVASGLSANFAGQPYSGSSDDQEAFDNIPYLTEDDDYAYLNLIPVENGRVYYYYTNTVSAPSAGEFDALYMNAVYKDNFYVQKGKIYSERTEDTELTDRYDYVVIQLVTNDRSYMPVLIDNTPTSGTGFSEDPYFDGEDILFTAEMAGTVYYYYTDEGTEVTAAQFQENYEDADSAMRGTVNATANRTGAIELTERYLENYPFVVILLQNRNEQYYKPVVVSAGDNGFTEEPSITTVGEIVFKTSVSGTLYYYYAETDDLPTPGEFASDWRTERGRDSIAVTRNRTGSIQYNESYADMYPYMVFCIKDDDDVYHTPFLLKIDIDTGFAVEPYASAADEISFKPEHTGTVYWYLTQYSTAPGMDDFMDEYTSTTNARRGTVSSRYTSGYLSFTFDDDYVRNYPYIAIMLVDSTGTYYQPVIVDVLNSTSTGFTVDPYCDLENEMIVFRAGASGTIYYYFSMDGRGYNQTPEEFMSSYALTPSQARGAFAVDTTLGYIDFSTVDTSTYPAVMIMFTDDAGRDSYPVYLSLKTDSSGGISTTGVTVQSVDDRIVTLSIDATGILSYYLTNSLYSTSGASNTKTQTVKAGDEVTLLHNGSYVYMVITLTGYESFHIDLTEAYDRNDIVTDGSTKSGYGFVNPEWDLKGSVTMSAIASVDGTVTLTSSSFIGYSDTKTVKKGEAFSVSIPVDLNSILEGLVGSTILSGVSFSVQLTADDGNVYERYTVPVSPELYS